VYNNTEHYPALLAPLALPRTPDRSKLFFGIHSAVLNHVRGELSLRTPIACTTTTHNFSWRVSVPYKKSFRRRKFLHGEPFKSSLKDSLTKFSLELKLQVSRLIVVLVHGQRCPSVRTTRHIRQQDDRSEPCFGRLQQCRARLDALGMVSANRESGNVNQSGVGTPGLGKIL
jgi:hypothetical protein